jgi:hypothetical protein
MSIGMQYASEMVGKVAPLNCRRVEVPMVLPRDGREGAPHRTPYSDGWRHLRYLIMSRPEWLCLPPGLALFAAGVISFGFLLAAPVGAVMALGPLWFGDRWWALAMGMTVSGHLSPLFAAATTLVGSRGGYRRVTRRLAQLSRCSRLGRRWTRLYLMPRALSLGASDWERYLSDSRIVERLSARLRLVLQRRGSARPVSSA